MSTFHCQNPVCMAVLANQETETSAKVFFCNTCNKSFCLHCAGSKTINNTKVNTCIYCSEGLIESVKISALPESENLPLAVEKRLSMGETAQTMKKAYCLKCFREVFSPDLSVLTNTPCENCGTTCYVDDYNNKYEGVNTTFKLSSETNSTHLKNFFTEYKETRDKCANNLLTGNVELNNWLFQNVATIHVFKVHDMLKNEHSADATIFENAYKLFKY